MIHHHCRAFSVHISRKLNPRKFRICAMVILTLKLVKQINGWGNAGAEFLLTLKEEQKKLSLDYITSMASRRFHILNHVKAVKRIDDTIYFEQSTFGKDGWKWSWVTNINKVSRKFEIKEKEDPENIFCSSFSIFSSLKWCVLKVAEDKWPAEKVLFFMLNNGVTLTKDENYPNICISQKENIQEKCRSFWNNVLHLMMNIEEIIDIHLGIFGHLSVLVLRLFDYADVRKLTYFFHFSKLSEKRLGCNGEAVVAIGIAKLQFTGHPVRLDINSLVSLS